MLVCNPLGIKTFPILDDHFPFLNDDFASFVSQECVDIWSVSLNDFRHQFVAFHDLLSAEERTRLAQFLFARHRERYVLEHGTRRIVLAAYRREKPATIEFSYGPFGKPEIKHASDRSTPCALSFSNAGTEDLALIAIKPGASVGIDVERVRQLAELNEIAARCFSKRERRLLADLAFEKRTTYFFFLWTAKEAVLKATGEGITRNLENVEVIMESDDCDSAHAIDRCDPHTKWLIQRFFPRPGYIASIALREGSYAVRHRQLVTSQ